MDKGNKSMGGDRSSPRYRTGLPGIDQGKAGGATPGQTVEPSAWAGKRPVATAAQYAVAAVFGPGGMALPFFGGNFYAKKACSAYR